MEQNVSKRINNFTNTITKEIETSGLPASILLLVINNVANQLQQIYSKEIAETAEVELGEGIEHRDKDSYNYDNNYVPQEQEING